MQGYQLRVDQYMTLESDKRIAKNCAFLKSIISCLELCGRQGIALRGHRDDSCSEEPNQGNFKALVQFRIDAGDVDLDSHLKEWSKRSTYILLKPPKMNCFPVLGRLLRMKL